MKSLNLNLGVEEYLLAGKVAVSFNPTDMNFLERLSRAFSELDALQEEVRQSHEKITDDREVFPIARELDGKMRGILNDLFGKDISEPLKLLKEKASRRRAPAVTALRDISSSCCVVRRATFSTLPSSACSLIRNLSTLSICLCLLFADVNQIPDCPCPFFIAQRVRVYVHVIPKECIPEQNCILIGIRHVGIR